jgi:GT2 family glycosyltransferase
LKDIAVSILILTYNRFSLTKRCVSALLEKIGPVSNEVLIWDNCSNDGTYDWLEEIGRADCRITEVFGSDENIGMQAINHLAKRAKGKYILKVDDDVEVPENFASRLVTAYEQAKEDKLLFLGWDMQWGEKTFATRSGMKLYKGEMGKIIRVGRSDRIFVHYTPSFWMVNGVCRLSPRDKFLEIGGHPEGMIYGVDHHVSKRAENHGYWIGYFSSKDLVIHLGHSDTADYRKKKNKELKKHGSPLHV